MGDAITRTRERYRRALLRALIEEEDRRGIHNPSEVARGIGVSASTAWRLMPRARARDRYVFDLRVAVAESMRALGYSRAAIAYQLGLSRAWVARRLGMPGDRRQHFPEQWLCAD